MSNCGCIPYRDSFSRDTGFQAEFVVPGLTTAYDVEDVLALAEHCRYLILAADCDKWSRGAEDIRHNLRNRGCSHVDVQVRAGGHDFPQSTRERAYRFLGHAL